MVLKCLFCKISNCTLLNLYLYDTQVVCYVNFFLYPSCIRWIIVFLNLPIIKKKKNCCAYPAPVFTNSFINQPLFVCKFIIRQQNVFVGPRPQLTVLESGWDLAEWSERLTANSISRNSLGFDPSILRHSGIWGEARLNKILKKV